MKKVFLIAILIILLILFFAAKTYSDFHSPKNSKSAQIFQFTVNKGEGGVKIAKNLEDQGLIRSALSFKIYVAINKMSLGLKAGQYELSQNMTIAQIAQKISQGQTLKKTLTIPEGWDLNDMAQYFEKENIFPSGSFLNSISNIDSEKIAGEFSFLSDKPRDAGIEGYIFPDTYEIIPSESSIDDFIQKALANFNSKLSDDLKSEIKKQKKSIFEIVTMASMIEKEVKSLEDKKIVSGILWKRMGIGMPLQIDATIAYITGRNSTDISITETKIDSLYNTYKYRGLPVGPICSPGLDSIIAAIYPQKSSYLYYLSTPEGKTIFSKTFEEHTTAKNKYLK